MFSFYIRLVAQIINHVSFLLHRRIEDNLLLSSEFRTFNHRPRAATEEAFPPSHTPSPIFLEVFFYICRFFGSSGMLFCEYMALQAEGTNSNHNDREMIPIASEQMPNLVDLSSVGNLALGHEEPIAMANSLVPVTSVGSCSMTSQGSFDSDENDMSENENNQDRPPAASKSLNIQAPLPLGVGAIGTVFRLIFLGSVEVDEEGGRKRRKRLKKNMVEEAVNKIKVCSLTSGRLHALGEAR